ncbi:unnamed protein product [Caenorhabditis auriculariae]|uniref:Uncharacterized protein n=1 Tax=Caenorhabditis auriculariae TaxID=2777116 RepID=A0A8S1HXN8_9PELO|nr:unnamed protein product [Caenorhabditis auriculariae]
MITLLESVFGDLKQITKYLEACGQKKWVLVSIQLVESIRENRSWTWHVFIKSEEPKNIKKETCKRSRKRENRPAAFYSMMEEERTNTRENRNVAAVSIATEDDQDGETGAEDPTPIKKLRRTKRTRSCYSRQPPTEFMAETSSRCENLKATNFNAVKVAFDARHDRVIAVARASSSTPEPTISANIVTCW